MSYDTFDEKPKHLCVQNQKQNKELLLCFDLPVATAICFICTTVPTRGLISNEASMVDPMQVQHHSNGFLFFCCQEQMETLKASEIWAINHTLITRSWLIDHVFGSSQG
ncbi:uncharacterized protein LOC107631608 [Arachis ipaensis]|uniref:uncharacterized protein LOC107631608 n=1 Tax=Arachis ipaensis TaxID=130454 RepID=UPI000A2B3942|nr:uncharacterized protein LOC107631608 [Arachis ipaensis]